MGSRVRSQDLKHGRQEVLEMRNRVLVPVSALALVTVVALWAPGRVTGQTQGQARSREEVQEAARKVSPVSEEEAAKVWDAEYQKAVAEATKRVYDPNKPLPTSVPKTPWGDPDLRGYYITATYTPLQRPRDVDKPLSHRPGGNRRVQVRDRR